MRSSAFGIVTGFCLMLGLSAAVSAQEGHPLKGSWIGVWEGNNVHDEFVLLVLDWDGESISGTINPGTENIEIDNAELNPEDWSVRIEADTEVDGRTINYEIQGTIENLALPNRQIVGTWRHQDGSGNFEISRQ